MSDRREQLEKIQSIAFELEGDKKSDRALAALCEVIQSPDDFYQCDHCNKPIPHTDHMCPWCRRWNDSVSECAHKPEVCAEVGR